MRIIIASTCFLLVSLTAFSQFPTDYENIMINPFWDFYSFNYLNSQSAGRGFTGISSYNDISGAMLNPASIKLDADNQINAQYTYKTDQPWLQSLGLNDISLRQQAFSGSLGYGRRIDKNFTIGFIYNNPSGMYFDLGTFIRTNKFGQEISSTDIYNNVSQHSFNIPFVYSNKSLSVGTNLSYTFYKNTIPGKVITTIEYPDGFPDGDFSATAQLLRGQLGVIYNYQGFSFGTSVLSGGTVDVTNKLPDGTESSGGEAKFPWRVGLGFGYNPLKTSWKFSLDYNYSNTNVLKNLNDRHDFHLGIENDITKNWTLKTGFFTLLDYRSNDINWVDEPGEYDQYFVTVGGGYKQKSFAVNLALLSSGFSGGIIKNTFINGGLTFNF